MMDAILSTRFMVTFSALLSSITAKFHYFYSASIISARYPKKIRQWRFLFKLSWCIYHSIFHLRIYSRNGRFLLLLINPGSLMVLTHTWRNEAPDICGMRYTMQPNMSAIGTRRLLNIWQRNEPKASITTLLYLMPSKSWFESFTILRKLTSNTSKLLKFF